MSPSRRAVAGRAAAVVAVVVLTGAATAVLTRTGPQAVPSFAAQACGLPPAHLARTIAGYHPLRSGQIQVLPRLPAYLASPAGGWTHSGPWPYLQEVPLVFYGPGIVPAMGEVDRAATLADVAPTLAALIGHPFRTQPGRVLREAVAGTRAPRLVVTAVWDGGGWNTLRQWPGAWPNLARITTKGVSFTRATVGSSPSVTPSVHTTIGTGVFPDEHGITDIFVFDDDGAMVDAFLEGESSRFIEAPTLGERWDEANGHRALVGMIGYEPWHLGMIGQGGERPGGDRDDAAWLDVRTNEWTTNAEHYRLPPALPETGGLQEDIRALDARDGQVDGAWGEHGILDDPDRLEESPAFIAYHGRAMRNLIAEEGYGEDRIADLLFTNFKQIDRLGHYFGMASDEVRASVVETDRELGLLLRFLDRVAGRGRYVVVVTADHGQQPDAGAVGGYAIDPVALTADLEAEFGPVVETIRPTQVFLDEDEMEAAGTTAAAIARWLADYRVEDNTDDPRVILGGSGRFGRADRLFDLAVPSAALARIDCAPSPVR